MPLASHHSGNFLEMNSGPLSVRIRRGFPWRNIVFSNGLTTRLAGMDIENSMATASRVQSSRTLSTLNARPLSNLSLTKSIDHVSHGDIGDDNGCLTQTDTLVEAHLLVHSIYLTCGSMACPTCEGARMSSRIRRRAVPPGEWRPQQPCRCSSSEYSRTSICGRISVGAPEICRLQTHLPSPLPFRT